MRASLNTISFVERLNKIASIADRLRSLRSTKYQKKNGTNGFKFQFQSLEQIKKLQKKLPTKKKILGKPTALRLLRKVIFKELRTNVPHIQPYQSSKYQPNDC